MTEKFLLFLKATAAAAIGLLLQANTAFSAAPLSTFEVTADEQVIYCSIGPVHTGERIKQALKEGTSVSFIWEITIESVNDYWLDDKIGTITIVRQVVPDLISRSWSLTDVSSGISHQVHSVDEAIQFLSRLERFPTLDRSLLSSGIAYSFSVDLLVQEGEPGNSWWSGIFKFSKRMAQEDITLP